MYICPGLLSTMNRKVVSAACSVLQEISGLPVALEKEGNCEWRWLLSGCHSLSNEALWLVFFLFFYGIMQIQNPSFQLLVWYVWIWLQWGICPVSLPGSFFIALSFEHMFLGFVLVLFKVLKFRQEWWCAFTISYVNGSLTALHN